MAWKVSRLASVAAIVLAIAAADFAGLLGPVDRALMDLRFRLVQREASGDIVIVQIDPASLEELDVWPWPRSYHARLIDRLLEAGVREIAIDVDLSGRGGEEGDKALVAALKRVGSRVVLPAFRRGTAPEANDARYFDTFPRAEFSAHAQIGAINVMPAPDGLIRTIADVQQVGDESLPALFALLAGPSAIKSRSFHIDFGIDPNSIPRVSYADVLRGEVDPSVLAGKSIIVGTTAAELGDTLAVPVYRSMSGAALQAMAFESALQGRDIQVYGSALSMPVTAALMILLTLVLAGRSWQRAVLVCSGTAAAIEACAIGIHAAAPVSLTTAPWIAAAGLSLLHAVYGQVESQARQIFAQRQALATRQAILDRMIGDSFDGIVIADQAGAIQVMNEAAAAILQIPLSEAMARPLDEILPCAQELMNTVAPILDEQQTTPLWAPCETIIRRANGDEVAIDLTISLVELAPKRSGGADQAPEETYAACTFRDISERMSAQDAQKRATEEALTANRAKTEFLANMSHELRTPLNAIIGFAEMIQSRVFGPIEPAAYGEYVNDIHGSGTHLLQIINDILDVSRIELGQYELIEEVVDLESTLRNCVSIAGGWPNFVERRFTVDIAESLPKVFADERVIKQTVINLLSNAFKYSQDDDQIRLAARIDESGDPVITVSDTGMGIADQELSNIMKAFYQVDGGFIRSAEGVGLGLFLCAGYARLHDGTLTIDSELGVGTTVTVRLPSGRIVPAKPDTAVPA